MSHYSSRIDASRTRISLEDCLEREGWLVEIQARTVPIYNLQGNVESQSEEIGSLSHNIWVIGHL